MAVQIGLDRLRQHEFKEIKGLNVGLICNQGAIGSDCHYAVDVFRRAHHDGTFCLKAIFGPQHGLFGHTQDNMIEWEGGQIDPTSGARIFSLYGENRKPTPEMLNGLDALVIDLPDIGARYYTFIWTTFLAMEACLGKGIKVVVLDRPNPLGGLQIQGTVLDPFFNSFVGLKPLPMRHGHTLGELALHFKNSFLPGVELEVVQVEGWDRGQRFPETGLPWSMPSPNMPTPDTALVYPGMCLLEGTNISEGRGTTRTFEIFGAPFLEGWKLADSLNNLGLKGVYFRPLEFQPTFQKHKGEICQGCCIHVTDPAQFDPCLATYAILLKCWELSNGAMRWNDPPYEYEYEKLPIDILAGNTWLRQGVESGRSVESVGEQMQAESSAFQFNL